MQVSRYKLDDTIISQVSFKLETNGSVDTMVNNASILLRHFGHSANATFRAHCGADMPHIELFLNTCETDAERILEVFHRVIIEGANGFAARNDSFHGVPAEEVTAYTPCLPIKRFGKYVQYQNTRSAYEISQYLDRIEKDTILSYQISVCSRTELLEEERWLRKMMLAAQELPFKESELAQIRSGINRRIECDFYGLETIFLHKRFQKRALATWSQFGLPDLRLVDDQDVALAALHPAHLGQPLPMEWRCATLFSQSDVRSILTPFERGHRPKPNTETALYDIFLSHSSMDKSVVESYYRKLIDISSMNASPVNIFLDSQSVKAGDPWQETIRTALLGARVVVVFLSRHTNASWYENDEIQIAIYRYRRGECKIVPVYLSNLPQDQIPFGLGSIQGLDSQIQNEHQISKIILNLLHA